MKVSTENDNNFGYEKITILVDNIPLRPFEISHNMWFVGKRESVNSWNKADFDGFREKDE
jgi:hypothetical protein